MFCFASFFLFFSSSELCNGRHRRILAHKNTHIYSQMLKIILPSPRHYHTTDSHFLPYFSCLWNFENSVNVCTCFPAWKPTIEFRMTDRVKAVENMHFGTVIQMYTFFSSFLSFFKYKIKGFRREIFRSISFWHCLSVCILHSINLFIFLQLSKVFFSCSSHWFKIFLFIVSSV